MAEQVRDGHAIESETLTISTDHDQVQADPNSALATSIGKMMQERARISPDCFIFRVPLFIRDSKEKLFHPRVVSIGPLHHGKEKLQALEKRKLDYLEAFLARFTVSLQTLIEEIKLWEKNIRNCYAETFKFSSDDFVMMILLDSCFVIEILWREYYYLDGLLHMHRIDIEMDLLLVENQLPFFVLQGIYDLAFRNSVSPRPLLPDLCLSFISLYAVGGGSWRESMEDTSQQRQPKIKHLLDLLRTFIKPSIPRDSPKNNSPVKISIPKLTVLEEAGLVIKPRLDYVSGLDICYNTTGVLEIPQFRITEVTECMLVNLVAFEYCLFFGESYVSDFIQFMDSLIDTSKDVDVLIQNGVIESSSSSDSQRVATLFNNLPRNYQTGNYFYYGIQERVNTYYKVPWNRWRASLRRDYLSSPWIIASTTAALVLLILTLIQAVCSIISVT